MLSAVILGFVFNISGLWLSYLWDVPSGATIIIIAAGVYLIAVGAHIFSTRIASQKT
jgi:zinc transport system permease protein